MVEAIEVSLYLVGVTAFSDALGRVRRAAVRRSARDGGRAPGAGTFRRLPARRADDAAEQRGLRAVPLPEHRQVIQALTALGIGYGEPGSAPGAFYDYPGDPLANGVGVPVESTKPQ